MLENTAIALASRGGEVAPRFLVKTPLGATNRQSTAANGGNKEAAVANNDANHTFTYDGKTYEIKATVPYKRPTNATTTAQRQAVNQSNASCVTCGTKKGPFNADHKDPLAVEHLSKGTIDKTKMRSVGAVQSQCKDCSNKQGGELRKVTRVANEKIKEKNNAQPGQ